MSDKITSNLQRQQIYCKDQIALTFDRGGIIFTMFSKGKRPRAHNAHFLFKFYFNGFFEEVCSVSAQPPPKGSGLIT